MTKMDDFTMEELMIFTVSILGALGGFMVVLQKSKCKSICWGCCIRDVDSGTTPRRMSLAEINRDVKLELKKEADEPEIEPSKN